MTVVVEKHQQGRTVRQAPRSARKGVPWGFLAPVLIAMGAWIYGPALFTGVLAFMEWNLTTPPDGFVGTANFAELFRYPEFRRATLQTVVYALALLPFATVLPMILAIMLWQRPGRASTIYRALLFLPVMIAPVAVAVSWQFILNPLQGLANEIVGWFSIDPVNWLGDPRTALPTIVIITAAKVTAFNMLLHCAALSALDRRTVEAARLEGATSGDVARFIVVPQLRRTTLLLGLLSLPLAGQWTFTNIKVLTRGGPDGTTDNVYYRIYSLAFELFDTGAASAAAVSILLAFAVAGCVWAGWRRIDVHR